MCGIAAFIGNNKEAFKNILNALYQLQNRGYDSAGISLIIDNDITTFKHASTPEESALELLNNYNYKSNIGIGHTRWATHGAKTDINSHPHTSYDGKFSLVHNGIIENFKEIKDFLSNHNIENKSQTDTEVIVNLIAYNYSKEKDIFNAIEGTIEKLTGTWGITFICIDEPNKILPVAFLSETKIM